jgi:hypothetical protein
MIIAGLTEAQKAELVDRTYRCCLLLFLLVLAAVITKMFLASG